MKIRYTLGFTLIELIVVVAIIGILTATTTFSYRATLVSSRDARRKADIENIRTALELYRSNNNIYPATASFSLDCASGGGLTDGAGNTYLSSKPRDPRCTSQTYYYTQLSSGADYTLGAMLEAPDTSSCGDCSATAGTQACNYCMGPYGKK
jgi:general secretion pathway protein G